MKFEPVIIDPMLEDIMDMFIENTILDLGNIRTGYNNKDSVQISKACHRILGTAKSYGFNQLDEIALDLQISAKKGEFDKVAKLIDTCDSYVEYIKGLITSK